MQRPSYNTNKAWRGVKCRASGTQLLVHGIPNTIGVIKASYPIFDELLIKRSILKL
jgi:hypothetical protein